MKETLKDLISAVLREHDKLGIQSHGALSQGMSRYLDNSNLATAGEFSPAASGYIECGHMLSNSPLPASSIHVVNFHPSHTIILLSATMPPHLLNIFVKPFGIKVKDLAKLRSSTNRLEIGMHLIPVEPITAHESLWKLVHALKEHLLDKECMLIFVGSQVDTKFFASQTMCAAYHSNLWQAGNTKVYNLYLWDQGELKVMACTTAFTWGIDRSNIRYVVIFRLTYGLIVNNQMMGRTG
ncbi:P-loop containing nucleoside triphosphate hydrolase protein [Suillus subluteus]|nr:P-loop containing nucleoside triphosphate hydrolase protein [Suillus subluteus]